MEEVKNRIELIIDSEQKCNRETIFENNLDNLFIFDDKNIYYDLLRDKIKDIKVLNLKELENSVYWNPLTYPYHLYKNGDIDNAIELINKIGFYIFNEPNADIFWTNSSSDYLTALTIHLFEKENDIDNINMMGILEINNDFEKGLLDEYYNKLDNKSLEYKLISSILNMPTDTKLSILSVFNQMMKIFSTRPNLSEKLSNDDINLDKIDLENKEQCIIVVGNPNLNTIANIFINQLYKVLEKDKSKQKVNIILDSLDRISKIEELENLLENDTNTNLNLIAITKNKENLINKYGKYTISLFKKVIDKQWLF